MDRRAVRRLLGGSHQRVRPPARGRRRRCRAARGDRLPRAGAAARTDRSAHSHLPAARELARAAAALAPFRTCSHLGRVGLCPCLQLVVGRAAHAARARRRAGRPLALASAHARAALRRAVGRSGEQVHEIYLPGVQEDVGLGPTSARVRARARL
ncbi:hypothetical protein T492DRAFT_1000089 [Pavlovales sp. CCMP2436]|nr:hypothetical protein T492DRAFT_1000089 [Pavlovales sp. CCMP2436]